MSSALLKGLSEEKVVLLKPSKASRLSFLLSGIVRLVDERGKTLALVLDRASLEEMEEDLEASRPAFLASLEASRRSGRVSGAAIKKRLGLG